MKKDIKKSSYYVWFLGAEEAKGLRGCEFMMPVIRHLVEREKEVDPFKVTLQVSHKGLKIMQNLPAGYPATKLNKTAGKTEVVKHFIPHHAITSVYQEEDIVSCILLLFNPVTKCPVHVHAYRCDSVETAEILSGQLQTITDRPENQKKLEEIESRLKAKGLVQSGQCKLRKIHSPASGSSDRSSARESDLSGGSSSSDRQESRIANLYDSLAAELKEKLCTDSQQNHAPILLPPRDYDTVHRQKGNLSGIDFRRCLNLNIVGMNAAKNKKNELISAQASGSKQHLAASPRAKVGSSGGSSGIGSDHAPSPDQETDIRYLDNQSTSDEEWNTEPAEDSLFLVQSANNWHSKELSLPRARRHNSSGFDSSPVTSPGSAHTPPTDERYLHTDPLLHRTTKPVRSVPSSDFERKQKYLEDVRVPKHTFFNKTASKSEVKLDSACKKRSPEERQRSPSPTEVTSPKERFKDAKEKFRLLERERLEEQEKLLLLNVEKRKTQEFTSVPVAKPRPSKNYKQREEEPVMEMKRRSLYRHEEYRPAENEFEVTEKRRSIARLPYHRNKSVESLNSEDYPSIPSNGYRPNENLLNPPRSKRNAFRDEEITNTRYTGSGQGSRMNRYCSGEADQNRMATAEGRRPRCRSPPTNASPRPATRSYSEDYLPEPLDNGKRYRDMSRSQHSVPFANDESIPLQRYRSPTRHEENRLPRNHTTSSSYPYHEDENQRRVRRSDSKYHDKVSEHDKRRSMLNSIEDEKRRNSNEIAKELKRRSYQDHRTGSEISYQGSLGYHEINEQDRYPGIEREVWTPNHSKLIKNGKSAGAAPAASPRYRHSYAEPFHHAPPINHHHHEILQRTNSSLSSGRIGIAAIHHY